MVVVDMYDYFIIECSNSISQAFWHSLYHNVRQRNFITKCDKLLLESALDTAKCERLLL